MPVKVNLWPLGKVNNWATNTNKARMAKTQASTDVAWIVWRYSAAAKRREKKRHQVTELLGRRQGRRCPVNIRTRIKIMKMGWGWRKCLEQFDFQLNLFKNADKHQYRYFHPKQSQIKSHQVIVATAFWWEREDQYHQFKSFKHRLTLGVIFQVGVMPHGVCQLPLSPQIRWHCFSDPPGLRTQRKARINMAYQEYPDAVSIIAWNPTTPVCTQRWQTRFTLSFFFPSKI